MFYRYLTPLTLRHETVALSIMTRENCIYIFKRQKVRQKAWSLATVHSVYHSEELHHGLLEEKLCLEIQSKEFFFISKFVIRKWKILSQYQCIIFGARNIKLEAQMKCYEHLCHRLLQRSICKSLEYFYVLFLYRLEEMK